MILKNDPDYVIEEYKGSIIASHKNNKMEKDVTNIIIVYDKEDFPEHGFLIGLDDTKMSGPRKMYPVNREDAISYIDWYATLKETKGQKNIERTSVPQTMKEITMKILAEAEEKRKENEVSQVQSISGKKGRRI